MKRSWINIIAVLFTLFILFIIYSANTGKDLIFFKLTSYFPYADKFSHATLLGLLTFILNLAFKGKTFSMMNKKWLWVSVAIFVIITLEEFSQMFIDNRTFDLLDLSANYLGIAVASWLIFYLNKDDVID